MRWLCIVFLVVLYGCQGTANYVGRSDHRIGKYQKSELEKRVEYISQTTKKSIVTIEVVKEFYLYGKKQKFNSGGSGSIISKDGLILTNYHVAGDAKKILVTLWNKKKIVADVIGEDPLTDLAIIKLRPEKLKKYGIELEPIRFGDYESVHDGDFVLALGSPSLLSRTATFGMVANRRRVIAREFEGSQDITGAENPLVIWIHHSAPIFGGNSGGPLVNMDGEQIGVNTRGGGGGMSFAVAITVVKDVVDRILKFGKPKWSYYGWRLQELTDELKELYKLPEDFQGVFVSDVVYGSPAYTAGVRNEDILLEVESKIVNASLKEEIPDILRLLAGKGIGEAINIKIKKKSGEVLVTKIIPEEWEIWETPLMAESPGMQREKDFYVSEVYGFSAQKITKKLAVKEKLTEPWGVFVTGIETGSIAANAQLNAGDIIKYIDSIPLTDMDTFKNTIIEFEKKRPEKIKLTVQRGNATKYIFFKDVERLISNK